MCIAAPGGLTTVGALVRIAGDRVATVGPLFHSTSPPKA